MIIRRLILSLSTTILYILGFIFYFNSQPTTSFFTFLSISFFVCYIVPLIIFLWQEEVISMKRLWLSSLITGIWIAVPLSLFYGFVFGSFRMDEFDTIPFHWDMFFIFSPICFLLFFVIGYIFLSIGGYFTFLLKKRKLKHSLQTQ